MGLKSLFRKAAKTAFTVAGDTKTNFRYSQTIDDGITSPVMTEFDIEVLFGQFSRKEKSENKNVQPGDVLGAALFSDMKVVPRKGDELRKINEDGTLDSMIFRVVAPEHDTAESIYELHLRTM